MPAATGADTIRENRLRRMAARRGLRLQKSCRRDPRALDYGLYWLVKAGSIEGRLSGVRVDGLTIDDIEVILTRIDDDRA
jgi:hypothetical protein